MKTLFLLPWWLFQQQFSPPISPLDYSLMFKTTSAPEKQVWVAPDIQRSPQITPLLHSFIPNQKTVLDKYIDDYMSTDPSHVFIGDLVSDTIPVYHTYSPSSVQRYNRLIEKCPMSFVEFCSVEERIARFLVDLLNEKETMKTSIVYIPPLFLETDSVQSFLTHEERSRINWIVDSLERDKDADAVLIRMNIINAL